MPPAARISDLHACPLISPAVPPILAPVPHVGGPVASGSPNVIVLGMPQARVGDQCICVGPPDVIAMGSPTVLVNGMLAARMGDATAHGGIINTGAPTVTIGVAGAGGTGGLAPVLVTPPMLGPLDPGTGAAPFCPAPPPHQQDGWQSNWRLGGDDNIDVMFFDGSARAAAADGRATAEADVRLGLLRMDHHGHRGWIGGGHTLEVATAEGNVYASAGWTGIGLQADGSARWRRLAGSVGLGRNENNPFLRADGEYSLGAAESKNRLLVGSDGREQGLEFGSAHKASVATGKARGEFGFRIPFTDWTFSAANRVEGDFLIAEAGGNVHVKRDEHGLFRAGAEAKVLFGGEVGAHAGRDRDTGRYHLGAKIGLSAILGGLLDVDLSIGPPYESRDRRH